MQNLATLVGHFIRYWGFRKIHGEIWTVVYLSKESLSGVEIGKLLNVSKALVSLGLKELEAEGLVIQIQSENSKTKRYKSHENVSEVIRGVLLRREKPMIDQIARSHQELAAQVVRAQGFNLERLEKMGLMIQMAQMGLTSLIDADQKWG